MVTGHALRPHRAELAVHPGPELLQPHGTTVPTCRARPAPGGPTLARMIPSTGSATWDTLGQIALALLMTTSLVLLVRDYRNRR